MDRREFLTTTAATATGISLPFLLDLECNPLPIGAGWIPNHVEIKRAIRRSRIKSLNQQATRDFTGSGKDKTVLLYKYLEQELGELVPHDQEIGDCCGQGYGIAIDTLSATQIHGLGLNQKFKAKASVEVCYAGSRFEIGHLQYQSNNILRVDGSYGVYCVEFINKYGMLPRGIYSDYDLTEYNPTLSRLWGRLGIPDELEPQIKEHPVQSYALVKNYEDCRDAIANGYPVVFCSSAGFNPRCRRHNPSRGRDDQGFLNRCGTWFHCMTGLGVDDTERPGVLLQNSWGDWVDGPKRHGQPDGSFWVDAKNIDSMCQEEDSYAISNFQGFPTNELDYRLF